MEVKNLENNLEPFEKIAELLKKHNKTRAWLNTLSSREKLVPKPIRQKRITLMIDEGKVKVDSKGNLMFKKQGSVIFYPKGTIEYLEEVIRLHDKDKLSYKEIKDKLQHKLNKLNLFSDINLSQDRRIKDVGFFYNYQAAIVLLCKIFRIYDETSPICSLLKEVIKEREKWARLYYETIQKMQQFVSKKDKINYEYAERERDILGDKLDFVHKIMEEVIKFVLHYIKEKKGGDMQYWIKALKIVEEELAEKE